MVHGQQHAWWSATRMVGGQQHAWWSATRMAVSDTHGAQRHAWRSAARMAPSDTHGAQQHAWRSATRMVLSTLQHVVSCTNQADMQGCGCVICYSSTYHTYSTGGKYVISPITPRRTCAARGQVIAVLEI